MRGDERVVLEVIALRDSLPGADDWLNGEHLHIGHVTWRWDPVARRAVTCDGHYVVSVDVSDCFEWGTADSEGVTVASLPDLRRAIDELMPSWKAARAREDGEASDRAVDAACVLYAARRRHRRPQGAWYTYCPDGARKLFDEAGEPRPTGLSNPYAPGEYDPVRFTATS